MKCFPQLHPPYHHHHHITITIVTITTATTITITMLSSLVPVYRECNPAQIGKRLIF